MTITIETQTEDKSLRLNKDLLLRAFDYYPLAAAVTGVLVLFNAIVLWSMANHLQIVFWAVLSVLIPIVRLLISRHRPDEFTREKLTLLQTVHGVLTTLSGMLWGVGAILLMPMNSQAHVLIYAITLMGVCSGAASTLASTPKTYLAYLLFCLGPIAIKFYFMDATYGVWLTGITTAYFYYMWANCQQNTQTITENLRQSYSLATQSRELSEAIKKLDLHYDQSPMGVVEWDASQSITRWNPAMERIYGLKESTMLGQRPEQFIPECGEYFSLLANSSGAISEVLGARNLQGEEVVCEWVSTPLMDDAGDCLGYTSFVTDVTEKVARDKLIQFQAYNDAVTGLANRYSFITRLEAEISRVQRTRDYSCVMFIDLDHFKTINDSLGHATGDELLRMVGERLKSRMRGYDLVARFGGDEFVVLLSQLDADHNQAELLAAQVAQSVQHLLGPAFQLQENQYAISCSIGMTLFNDASVTQDELLKQADLALYQSKDQGRNHYSFFERAMGQQASRHLMLLTCLREATAREEMLLVYQPKVDLEQRQLKGAEVLLRWQSQQHGAVSPAEFIPILEVSALIIQIGAWVLDQSLGQLAIWLADKKWDRTMRLAINISPNQLLEKSFVQSIKNLLAYHGISGHLLEFEITENVLVQDTERVARVLSDLSELGISFAIDDFGTGYSSLAYLKNLPIQVLKIDKSFVDHCTEEGGDRAIIQSMLSICRSLNLTSVAEGVETDAQSEALRQMGCDLLQGYLFSKPLVTREFEALLERLAIVS